MAKKLKENKASVIDETVKEDKQLIDETVKETVTPIDETVKEDKAPVIDETVKEDKEVIAEEVAVDENTRLLKRVNREKGIRTPGLVKTVAITRADGTVRYLSETLSVKR